MQGFNTYNQVVQELIMIFVNTLLRGSVHSATEALYDNVHKRT